MARASWHDSNDATNDQRGYKMRVAQSASERKPPDRSLLGRKPFGRRFFARGADATEPGDIRFGSLNRAASGTTARSREMPSLHTPPLRTAPLYRGHPGPGSAVIDCAHQWGGSLFSGDTHHSARVRTPTNQRLIIARHQRWISIRLREDAGRVSTSSRGGCWCHATRPWGATAGLRSPFNSATDPSPPGALKAPAPGS